MVCHWDGKVKSAQQKMSFDFIFCGFFKQIFVTIFLFCVCVCVDTFLRIVEIWPHAHIELNHMHREMDWILRCSLSLSRLQFNLCISVHDPISTTNKISKSLNSLSLANGFSSVLLVNHRHLSSYLNSFRECVCVCDVCIRVLLYASKI